MDFEQILIRLGVDAKAVTIGLTQVKSFVKGWATSVVTDMKHHLMGSVGGAAVMYGIERLFDAAKEKALFLKRLNNETGLSTNTLQGMAAELGYVGEGFEDISKPLGKFNVLIGQAKEGIPAARQKLIEWGIATKSENWNTLTATKAIQALAVQFDRLGDKQKQAALLQAVYGKQWQAMFPIFEAGAKHVADMDRANFFTKMRPETIEMFASMQRAGTGSWNVLMATSSNMMAKFSTLPALLRNLEALGEGHHQIHSWEDIKNKFRYVVLGIKSAEMEHNDALKEKQGLLQENLHVQQMINEQHKLENELADRNKLTVGELADRAREIMGDKSPRGLKSIYAVTPGMAAALRVQKLEDAAKAAVARGNQSAADNYQSEADRIRLSNSSLRSTEQDPMKAVREHLEIINETLSRAGIVVKSMPKSP